jgi:hypothetical protein
LFRGEGLSWLFGAIESNSSIQNVTIYETPFFYRQAKALVEQLAKNVPSDRKISINISLYEIADPDFEDNHRNMRRFSPASNPGILLSTKQSQKTDLFPSSEAYHSSTTKADGLSGALTAYALIAQELYYPRTNPVINKNPFVTERNNIVPEKVNQSLINSDLTRLDLSCKNLNDQSIEKLATNFQSHASMKLESLVLSKNDLTSNGIKLLAEHILPKLPCLTHLDISENQFDENGLQYLISAIMKYKIPLRSLDIGGNNIGDSGISLLRDRYLLRDIELQFLGLRNLALSEKSHPHLIALLKQNCTLLKIDIDGNLLLSEQAQNEVKKYLLRNNKLLSHVQLLRQKKSFYQESFMEEARKLLALMSDKKIENLNKIISFLSFLEKDWEHAIKFSYETIKRALERNGAHPLLADFTEIEKNKKRLRSGYDMLLQGLQSYPHKWKNNRVVVRIWKPGSFNQDDFIVEENLLNNMFYVTRHKQNVGHVSVEIEERYISFWPGKKGTNIYFNFNTKIGDEQEEGPNGQQRMADIVIVLYSLDVADLNNYFDQIRDKRIYSMIPNLTMEFREDNSLANCASLVLELLLKGSLEKLLPKDRWPARSMDNGVAEFHPLYIAELIAEAKRIELQRYPFTKNFDVLHNDEKKFGAIREKGLMPDDETKNKFSQTHFFAWVHGRNMKAIKKEDIWETTEKPIYLAEENYTSTNDHELTFNKGDLLEDWTEEPHDLEIIIKNQFLDVNMNRDTRKPALPGWVLHKYRQQPAIAVLNSGEELRIIGINGEMDDPKSEIICQEEISPGNFNKREFRRELIRLRAQN